MKSMKRFLQQLWRWAGSWRSRMSLPPPRRRTSGRLRPTCRRMAFHLTSDIYIPVDGPAGEARYDNEPGAHNRHPPLREDKRRDRLRPHRGLVPSLTPRSARPRLSSVLPALPSAATLRHQGGRNRLQHLHVKAAKTFDKLGRFSVGYYTGNDRLLLRRERPRTRTECFSRGRGH